MNNMKCIAAYYGYYESPSKIWGLDFRFGELPQPAVRAFKDLKERFQWVSSNPNEIYKDCYALWPVDQDQVLAVRFRDMGRDQVQDRLHPIRIEVALVTRELCPNWPKGLATMLSAVAWEASNTDNDPAYIQLNSSVEPPQISDKIFEALSSRKLPSIFYSTHTNGAPNSNQDGFDIIQMPSREIVKRTLVNHVINKPSVQPDQRTSVKWRWISNSRGFLLSTLIGVFIGALSVFILLQTKIKETEQKSNKLENSLNEKITEASRCKDDLNKSQTDLKNYKENHNKWMNVMNSITEMRKTNSEIPSDESINQSLVSKSIEMRYSPHYSDYDKRLAATSEMLSELINLGNSLIKNEININYEDNTGKPDKVTTKISLALSIILKRHSSDKRIKAFIDGVKKSEDLQNKNKGDTSSSRSNSTKIYPSGKNKKKPEP